MKYLFVYHASLLPGTSETKFNLLKTNRKGGTIICSFQSTFWYLDYIWDTDAELIKKCEVIVVLTPVIVSQHLPSSIIKCSIII